MHRERLSTLGLSLRLISDSNQIRMAFEHKNTKYVQVPGKVRTRTADERSLDVLRDQSNAHRER